MGEDRGETSSKYKNTKIQNAKYKNISNGKSVAWLRGEDRKMQKIQKYKNTKYKIQKYKSTKVQNTKIQKCCLAEERGRQG